MKVSFRRAMRLSLLLILVFSAFKSYSQNCTGCTSNVTTNTSLITVNPGDVICIDPGVVVDVVELQGGTICNEGSIRDLQLNNGSGVVNNYSSIENQETVIDIASHVTINNFPYAEITFHRNTSIDLHKFKFALENYNGAKFNFQNNDLSVFNGTLRIDNGLTWPADPSITDLALINLAANFNSSDNEILLQNLETGYLNTNGSFNLQRTKNRQINNLGLFEILGSFNTAGTSNNNLIQITNSGQFNVQADFNSSITNASVTLLNTNSFLVWNNISLSGASHSFTNSSQFISYNQINFSNSTFTNNDYMSAASITLTSSIFHNNNGLYISDIVNVNSTINNNSYINANSVINTGTINLARKTFVMTNSYSNTGNGRISGPASISDTSDYAKMVIIGTSTNSTWVDNYILIHDRTIIGNSTNTNYGFDDIANASKIGGNIFFAAKAVGPGSPAVGVCAGLYQLYFLTAAKSPNSVVCQGTNVQISSQFNQVVTFTVPFMGLSLTYTTPITIPNNSFTWTPGPLIGQYHMVNPTSTTTYTVKVNYQGCTFTMAVTVTVTPHAVSITANQTGTLCFPSSGLTLNGTVSTPGAYVLQWYLNGSAIPGASGLNYTPSAPGTYDLNMTPIGGCPGKFSNTVIIYPKPSVTISASALGICLGVPVTFNATIGQGSGSGFTYQWTQNLSNIGTNSNQYIASSGGAYAVNVTNSNGCVGTSNAITIQVSTGLTANAGPDQIYFSTPVPIGGNPACATGGVQPYTSLWSSGAGFVTGNINQCNNTVAPTASTIYSLTVTDAAGCQSTDDVYISIGAISYIVPKKEVDGGYQIPLANRVYFKFEEEYKNGTLSYKILDYNSVTANIQPASIICSLVPPAKSLGDNRYYIDITNCSLQTAKFYLVEVTTDKNEKFYFKFLN